MGDQQAMALATSAAVGRAEMQDWTLLPQILTRAVWQVLLSTEERQLKKIDCLVKYLVSFGLRHPSERTCAVVCALVSRNDGMEGDAPRQVALLATVKSVFKTCITRAKQAGTPLPGGYLAVLPADPGNLPQALRSRFELVASPVEVAPVLELAFAWALRSSNRTVLLHRAQQGALGLPAAAQQFPALAYHPAGVQSAQAFLAFGQAALPQVQPTIPGFHLTAAGVAAAAAASGLQGRRQAGGHHLRSLLDRADRSAAPAAASVSAPNQENAQSAVAASATPVASQVSVAPAADAIPGPATQQVASIVESVGGHDASAPGAGPPAAMAAVEPIGTAPELEEHVVALAHQHYNKDLPTSESLEVKKRPSGRGKVVAKEPGTNVAPNKIAVKKKPAAAGGKGPPPVLKRPSANVSTLTRAEAARLRPNGCGKCRNKVGCTPSCWLGRGRQLVD